ncbi:MAG TPA: sulfite exporter TauE/SafE family protein [Burkholderiales bacterium]|nr:sulfite exporter TauE/SafE family protein [Burkholderiales bacterium]
MEYLHVYLALGIFVGFIGGLLGVGGGIVIVPALTFCFAALHFPEAFSLHTAIGTSLACIVFGSISSLREHHAHGAVDWSIVKGLAPGVVIGTLLGSKIVVHIPVRPLKIFFICFVFYAATQAFLNLKPKPTRQLPGSAGLFGAGGVIGLLSSFVGIGGGAISVPFMVWCNVKMHNAIGTSAALGFPIAVAGAVGFIVSGLNQTGLPPYSLGFVYLPALLGIAGMSVVIAPFGARLAHRLPVTTLKRVFGGFLYVVGAKMAYDLFA